MLKLLTLVGVEDITNVTAKGSLFQDICELYAKFMRCPNSEALAESKIVKFVRNMKDAKRKRTTH